MFVTSVLTAFVLLVLLLDVTDAGRGTQKILTASSTTTASSSSSTGVQLITRGRSSSSSAEILRRLQEELNIGDDPTEDIRTNRFLNMEGI